MDRSRGPDPGESAVAREEAAPREAVIASLAVAGYTLGLGLPGLGLLPVLWLAGLGLASALAGGGSGRPWHHCGWLIAYLLSTGFAIALSLDPGHSLLRSLGLVPGLLLYALLVSRCGAAYGPWLVLALALGAALPNALLLVMAAGQPEATPQAWLDRLDSPLLRVPNDVLFAAVIAPLVIDLIRHGAWRWQRWLATATLLVSGLSAVVLGSRGAVLLLVMALAGGLLSGRSPRFLAVGLAAVCLGLLLDAALGFRLLGKFTALETLWQARLPVWMAGLTMYLDHPLSGVGPHVFRSLYPDYFFELLSRDWVFPDSRQMSWVHNLYLETLVEQGLLGLVTLLGLLGVGIRRAWRGSESALLLAWGGFVLAGFYESSFARLWVVTVWFFLLGLSRQVMVNDGQGSSERQP